jgi:hypothetical protein
MIDSRARVLCVEYAGGIFFDICVLWHSALPFLGGFVCFGGE